MWFSDGAFKDVDVSGLLARGAVFARVRDDRSVFEQVRVKPGSGTIDWPGDVDLDPDVFYGRAGAGLRRLDRTANGHRARGRVAEIRLNLPPAGR